ncbi:hypothetical protein [Nonomuraea bangladeshensis]|uniref:hypothetical protein n=1 Tax=Nonomuraea bangladeshensis TaxID=404385 RepID=UPI003C2B2E89
MVSGVVGQRLASAVDAGVKQRSGGVAGAGQTELEQGDIAAVVQQHLNAPVSWVVYFGPTSDADDCCLERADMTVIGADGGIHLLRACRGRQALAEQGTPV